MAEYTIRVNSMSPALLLGLCRHFEDQYNLSSEVFYDKYLEGVFVGNHNAYRWAGYWEAYLERCQPIAPIEKGHEHSLAAG